MAKFKERILKAAREKTKSQLQGTPIRLSADFSRHVRKEKGVARYSKCPERENL